MFEEVYFSYAFFSGIKINSQILKMIEQQGESNECWLRNLHFKNGVILVQNPQIVSSLPKIEFICDKYNFSARP